MSRVNTMAAPRPGGSILPAPSRFSWCLQLQRRQAYRSRAYHAPGFAGSGPSDSSQGARRTPFATALPRNGCSIILGHKAVDEQHWVNADDVIPRTGQPKLRSDAIELAQVRLAPRGQILSAKGPQDRDCTSRSYGSAHFHVWQAPNFAQGSRPVSPWRPPPRGNRFWFLFRVPFRIPDFSGQFEEH